MLSWRLVLSPSVLVIGVVLLLGGCAHQPLPRLEYRGANAARPAEAVSTSVALEEGEMIGHALTSYALMPGGWAMPIKSGPSPVNAFNTEDQAAFVTNLTRVLTERGVITVAGDDATAAAKLTVKFLKIEHFPEMQDYVMDALVTAAHGGRTYEKVYHVSTIDEVNLVARMFQHSIDGRRRAAESLLAAVVPELEAFFAPAASPMVPTAGSMVIDQPFATCAAGVERFLRQRYARPTTFWKGGISVFAQQPSPNVVTIELRSSDSDLLPPFCVVDLYASDGTTRVAVRERNPLLSSRARVAEALQEYAQGLGSAPTVK